MTGAGNWTYLVTGAEPALIDAGIGAPEHLDRIAEHVPDGPANVFVTHGHRDHASGVTALAARWPRIRFWKLLWPPASGNVEGPCPSHVEGSFDPGYAITWNPLSDNQVVPAGDESLQVVYTPGHAPDHVAFWHSPSRTLFSGDLVVLGSTVVIPASAGGDLREYLASLRHVLALDPWRLLPAHGRAIDDPKKLIGDYLAHRQERERQVMAALQSGLRTVDAIADHIYVGLAAPLVSMARESVLAHLRKLERDGLVTCVGGEWRSPASSE